MNDREAIPPNVLRIAKALAASGIDLGDVAKPKDEREKPYRVAEVARLLDVHRATVYRDIEAGRCEAYRIGEGSGALRIAVEDFEAYKTRLKSRATATRQESAVAS